MELLAGLLEATNEETEAETEEKIGQDAAEDRGLDDGDEIAFIAVIFRRVGLVLRKQDNEEDNLDDRSKRRLDENTSYLGQLPRKLLSSEAKQIGSWNDSNIRGSKFPEVQTREELKDDSDEDKRPEDVYPFRRGARASPENSKEVTRMKTASPAFSLVGDVTRDLRQKRG